VESFAQFLYVGFVEVTFLVQDFGHDAFRPKDGDQVFLADYWHPSMREEPPPGKRQEWNDALLRMLRSKSSCNRRWRANVQRILCRHCNQILATHSHRNRQGSECNVDGDTPGCLSQDSGSASSRAVRSSCFEGANGFVTVTPFQVKPSCRSSVRRSRQPDSAAADRITESQISSW
jgi:hypothetical protein